MRRSIRLAVCLLAATTFAAPGEIARKDFAYVMPVTTQGNEGLASATLPLAVYTGSERRDLGDIRVYNSAGDSLPYALLSPPASAPQPSVPVKVPIFPLWAQPGVEAGALSVRIEQGARGAIVGVKGAEKTRTQPRLAGYIVDMSALKKPIQAIVIDWKPAAKAGGAQGFSGEIGVESSDDLGRWISRARGAPLVTLQHDGDSLTLNRVEIPAAEAKYLRLSWPAAQDTPEFTQVRVETAIASIETPRVFTTAVGAIGAKAGEYQFDVKAAAPFDRLRVTLPNANTVANVQLLARTSGSRRLLNANGCCTSMGERSLARGYRSCRQDSCRNASSSPLAADHSPSPSGRPRQAAPKSRLRRSFPGTRRANRCKRPWPRWAKRKPKPIRLRVNRRGKTGAPGIGSRSCCGLCWCSALVCWRGWRSGLAAR
jgi:hypothetical protein